MLILINIFTFFYTVYANPACFQGNFEKCDIIKNYGFSVKNFLAGKYETIITSMFLHANLQHLVANMIALFFLGSALEKRPGRIKYIIAYLLGGIAGNFSMFVPIFAKPKTIAIGASAAISGLIGLGIFTTPTKLVLFPTFIPFPFMIAGAIYLLATLANLFEISHIGYHAHLFGLLAGGLFGLTFTTNRKKKLLIFIIILIILALLPTILGIILG
jgi:membrane associated rhomboid family serine protease